MGPVFALLTALLLAASDVLTRRLFVGDAASRPRDVLTLRLLLSVPLLALALPVAGSPPSAAEFWIIVAVGAPLEIAALLLYLGALRAGPISTSLPLLAATPVLLLVAGPVIAGDEPAPAAAPGVLLVAAGAYALHLGKIRQGWAEPLLALARSRGARMMLGVAVIYSITSALGKRGVVVSSPAVMAVYYFLAVAVLGSPVARPRTVLRLVRAHTALAVRIGLASTAQLFTHMAALALMPAAEMIALKRLSLLFGSAAGVFLLGERGGRARLAGAALMVAGAIWIGVS
ncbi:MAG: EamA family transporter [Acidobacteria bacterium]|nr:EamA family transporter [Acidobacteriota bacterium]